MCVKFNKCNHCKTKDDCKVKNNRLPFGYCLSFKCESIKCKSDCFGIDEEDVKGVFDSVCR